MKPLYTIAQIRDIERAAAAALPAGTLMRRAGLAAANAALELLADLPEPSVLVLAGPGNNGGDALEVAANLAQAGIDVALLYLAGTGAPAAETAQALARAQQSAAQFVDALPAHCGWSLVVDGLFGIGLARPLAGVVRALADAAFDCPVLALDVPTGLDADTGAIVGPDGIAMRATHTITFIGDKPGLHTCEGQEYAGRVLVARLDIGAAHYPPAQAQLNGPELFAAGLRPRARNSHKGSFGDVVVVGGAQGMAGAPLLAARGALYCGAGRVYVAALDPGPGFDSVQPEIMFRNAHAIDFAWHTLVLGPGMGQSTQAAQLLDKALASTGPLLLDADALNLLAAEQSLQARLPGRGAVLTPHPLEAARLLGASAAAVQADRLKAARELAARFQAVVVLKGAGTLIAQPGGAVALNATGNPGLASAGTGDVLAGICGALLAQGWPASEAALGAVWIHGTAADRLVELGAGPIGLTAGELPAAARAVLNQLVGERPRGGRPRS